MNETLLVTAVLLAALAVAVSVIRAARRQKQQAVEKLQRLGFFELTGSDQDLLSALRGLVPGRRQQVAVGTIYRRTAGYSDMYAFYPDIANNNSTTLAVRVPHLDLPLFRLFGKIEVGGLLGGLANNLVLGVIGRGLKQAAWQSDPSLGEHFFLFAEDPGRVERFVIENWGSLLRDKKNHIAVFGKGNLLAFSRGVNVNGRRVKAATTPQGDSFSEFVQTVDLFVRSLRTDSWDSTRRTDHTVA
jgi:hypothetical protein